MSKHLLELRDVNLKLGSNLVLENVSFSLDKGDIVSVIGLNGTGKTSLLKTILGIYRPSGGKVILNTKRIGYVPQRLDFDRSVPVTVFEFLSIYSGVSAADINTKLAELDSTLLTNKLLSQLSGGEMQRVLFAQALLREPELLLLDEASSGLDVTAEDKFYEILTRISADYKLTVLLVSHDIHVVFSRSTQILCLHHHVCCKGTPEQVSHDPQFTKIFGKHFVPYKHRHGHTH